MSIHRAAAGEAVFGAGATTADRRAAVQREEREREVLRQENLAAQRSPLNTPEARIRIWERLHSLSLPINRTHKLVRVIAQQTGLTVREVQEEQRHRAGEPVSEELADHAPQHAPQDEQWR